MVQSTLNQADLVTYDHAAAGHEGVLSDESGSVVIKPCTVAEKDFYETSLISHPHFASFMPIYMGTLELSKPKDAANPEAVQAAAQLSGPTTSSSTSADDASRYRLKGKALTTELGIVLSNVAAGFKRPNVLDLKLGAQLWDDKASQDKRARLDKVAAETTSSSLGFRIAGMKVWQGAAKRDGTDADGFRVFDKFYGRKFSAETVQRGFEEYFVVEGAGLSRQTAKTLAARVARDVRALQGVLETQESRMYSASILVVVEGDGAILEKAMQEEKEKGPVSESIDEDSDDGEGEERLKVHTVKMIDFAHAQWTPGQGPDENVLRGVRSVVQILDRMS